MRVAVVALLQESNTFAGDLTALEDFSADVLLTGLAVRSRFDGAPHEVGGFFAALDASGIEAVPVFAARAVPSGPIAANAFNELIIRLRRELDACGRVDGVLAAAHGATVSEEIGDVDGHWLSIVRDAIGPATPLISTLDPHANLSSRMVKACNAIIAYRTNPHLDQWERGLEAAELMIRTLRGDARPRQAAAFPPMMINIECQNTGESPCADLYAIRNELENQPGILSASILLGFPYADVPEVGAAAVVVAAGDDKIARRAVHRLGSEMWRRRNELQRQPDTIEAAVARTRRSKGPVCLLDVGDNVGGGGPGDSTYLAQSLVDAKVAPALVCIHDPDVVRLARELGEGGTYVGRVGGKNSPLSGPPLCGAFLVRRLANGKFSDHRPRHGGFVEFDQGPTVVLETRAGLTVVVVSRRTPPFSLKQLTSCGVEPQGFRAIVAKGVHAPLAAYREVCTESIRVNTPGVTTADLTRLTYLRRRRPLFPLENDACWDAETCWMS